MAKNSSSTTYTWGKANYTVNNGNGLSKKRISLRLNDYEYSALYRIQMNCIMTGVNYNRALQINEIVRGILSYVYFSIKQDSKKMEEFAEKIRTLPEYPPNVYISHMKIPEAAGTYIFFPNEQDIVLMDKMGVILEKFNKEKYEYTQIIRYSIRYILFDNPLIDKYNFLYTQDGTSTRKADFILTALIGNLYGLTPRLSVELLKDPLIETKKLDFKTVSTITRIPRDEQIYLSTKDMFLKEMDQTGAKLNWPEKTLESMDLKNYDQYNSNVSDFNFLSVIFGLAYVTYMYQTDSFDLIKIVFFSWQKENLEKQQLPPRTFIPAKILVPLGPAIRQFVILFNSLLEKTKKF